MPASVSGATAIKPVAVAQGFSPDGACTVYRVETICTMPNNACICVECNIHQT
ncbi:MAG: hypothetical protein AAB332_05820 [Planctomycetota bacterium]